MNEALRLVASLLALNHPSKTFNKLERYAWRRTCQRHLLRDPANRCCRDGPKNRAMPLLMVIIQKNHQQQADVTAILTVKF